MVSPIIVGTIAVNVGRYFSTASMTAAGSKNGQDTVCPPMAGPPSTANIDAAWNIGVCRRLTVSRPHSMAIMMW